MSLERYKKNAPNGYCGDPGRGAAMGRPDINPKPKAEPAGPLTACHVLLDSEGYDPCGTYWGFPPFGDGLYFVHGSTEDGEDIEMLIWAVNILMVRFIVDELGHYVAITVILGEDIDFPKDEEEDGGHTLLNDDALVVAMEAVVDDNLAEQHTPEDLPTALSTVFYAMCLRACDHGAGAHDLAEMLRDVARRLDSADEDVVQDRRDEGDAAMWGMA